MTEDGKGDAAGIVEELREEWEALGLVPYHGIGTSLLMYGEAGWYADLGKADIAKIRGLLNRSAAEVERLTRDLEKEQRATSEYVRAARFEQERANKADALVERLTRERDEARATIASQEFRKECADTPLMRDVMAEREAARAEVGRLSGLVAELDKIADDALALLDRHISEEQRRELGRRITERMSALAALREDGEGK